jgi:SRSO17 transposase
MDLRATEGVASRFVEYVEHLSNVIGHADRHGPLASYCSGLLLPGERKSVEPMAPRLAPGTVGAKHQLLHHFVAKAPWDEAELLAAVRGFVVPKMKAWAPIRAWIVDDTGIPKKGKHSVGVARQYCGEAWSRHEHTRENLSRVRESCRAAMLNPQLKPPRWRACPPRRHGFGTSATWARARRSPGRVNRAAWRR